MRAHSHDFEHRRRGRTRAEVRTERATGFYVRLRESAREFRHTLAFLETVLAHLVGRELVEVGTQIFHALHSGEQVFATDAPIFQRHREPALEEFPNVVDLERAPGEVVTVLGAAVRLVHALSGLLPLDRHPPVQVVEPPSFKRGLVRALPKYRLIPV